MRIGPGLSPEDSRFPGVSEEEELGEDGSEDMMLEEGGKR